MWERDRERKSEKERERERKREKERERERKREKERERERKRERKREREKEREKERERETERKREREKYKGEKECLKERGFFSRGAGGGLFKGPEVGIFIQGKFPSNEKGLNFSKEKRN